MSAYIFIKEVKSVANKTASLTPADKLRAFGSCSVLFGVNLYLFHQFGAALGYPNIVTKMFGWMPNGIWELIKGAATWGYLHL
jgi:hypothetical protein